MKMQTGIGMMSYSLDVSTAPITLSLKDAVNRYDVTGSPPGLATSTAGRVEVGIDLAGVANGDRRPYGQTPCGVRGHCVVACVWI